VRRSIRYEKGLSARAKTATTNLWNNRKRHIVVVVFALALAAIAVPAAMASNRAYITNTVLPSNTDATDLVYHNHTYNDMHWGTTGYPGEIFQETPAGAVHYYHSFNGNYGTGDPGTYYTTPFCGNLDSVSHNVQYCSASW